MAYGNQNLLFVQQSSYITTGATSDLMTLHKDTNGVELYATKACWINIGQVPVAAAAGAEKTAISSFYLPDAGRLRIAVPVGTDAAPMKIAAIQATEAGDLHILELRD